MSSPDLNQLITLDVLLAEGSVVRAAKRLRLSQSAMSRALSRLRETMGDPLLVRAGRGLVPTPRALALRERVHRVVEEAEGVLRPAETLDHQRLFRTFSLRTSDGFVESFGPGLLALIAKEAPGVRLHFLQKLDKDSALLRDGRVDLETGVIEDSTGPEVLSQALFRDRFGFERRGCRHERIAPATVHHGDLGALTPQKAGCVHAAIAKPENQRRGICLCCRNL